MKKWFLALALFCVALLAYCNRRIPVIPVIVPDDVIAVNISYTSPHHLDVRRYTDAKKIQAVTDLLREMTPTAKHMDVTNAIGGGFWEVTLCSSDGSEIIHLFRAEAYQPQGSSEWFYLPYEQGNKLNKLLYTMVSDTP